MASVPWTLRLWRRRLTSGLEHSKHLALAGFTKTALDLHDDQLRSAIEERYSNCSAAGRKKRSSPGADVERYSLVARRAIGGIALLVYAREASVAARVRDVQVATVGCGVFGLMGNKGAVGIRVVLDERSANGETSSWTFVTAHLAAHQNKNKERARDWKSIVERLVFEGVDGEKQMFDTGHVFFFGVRPASLPSSGSRIHRAATRRTSTIASRSRRRKSSRYTFSSTASTRSPRPTRPRMPRSSPTTSCAKSVPRTARSTTSGKAASRSRRRTSSSPARATSTRTSRSACPAGATGCCLHRRRKTRQLS